MTDPLENAPDEAREFYLRCAAGELAVQQCSACGLLRHHPRPHCTGCLSADYRWLTCSGRGEVFTFTVIRVNQNPRFRAQLPYVVAVVELEEGVRMLTGLRDVDPELVSVGMPVQVVFDREQDGRTVPRFAALSSSPP